VRERESVTNGLSQIKFLSTNMFVNLKEKERKKESEREGEREFSLHLAVIREAFS